MTPILLFALLVAVVHSIPALKRQQTIPLWGTCNEPSVGVMGPLPCADGSQCICKDATFSQCREQINGVWSDDPSWQCQQPGDTPSGSTGTSSTGGTTGGGSSSVTPVLQSSQAPEPVASSAPASTPSTSINTGQDTTGQQSGQPSPSSGQTGSMGTSQDLPEMYANASATLGGCNNVQVPDGWDGVASTTYYGYMGTACMCGAGNFGQASWQANTGESLGIGQGIYSGAVDQKLFGGTLNSAGQPGCGTACGVCYELMTTGVNAYNGGTAGGSTIQIMVVDACYGQGGAPHWCSSNTDSGNDDFGCGAHFDIDTDPTLGNVPAIGQDGTTWENGGQMVLYRRTACPSEMTDAFDQDCKSHC